MTQADMNLCAEAEWQAADAALNDLWPQVRSAMQATDADLPAELQGAEQALLQAQRAWITFRDAQCAAEGFAMRGGSAEPLLVYGCLRQLTADRTAQLQAMIQEQ